MVVCLFPVFCLFCFVLFCLFFSFFLFHLCPTGLDRLQTENMDGTSINISSSSSATFTLPTASSLGISGVDDETVDIRASKQLLSDSVWSTTYIICQAILESFLLLQGVCKHTSHPSSHFWSKKLSLILIAWSWLSKLKFSIPSAPHICSCFLLAWLEMVMESILQTYLLFVYIWCSEGT